MEYVLTVRDLTKRYGRFTALNGLSMSVPKGAIYGLVGRNGAGKTTLIRVVCGLQAPTSGTYALYGLDRKARNISRSRRRMGAVVETPSFYPDMTAEDNLRQQYMVLGLPSYEGIPDLLRLVGLENTGRKKARNFSLGMKQRLGIAVALAGDPDFLVLISSHILDELSRLATHYGFVDSGRMLKELSAEELDAACRKCMRLTVSSVSALSRVLDAMGVEYQVLSEQQADVFARLNISRLTLALAKEGCEVLSLEERDESLESFYVNLVGDSRHG